jgi:CubicO group peptidase (beta-lactamase class C family)
MNLKTIFGLATLFIITTQYQKLKKLYNILTFFGESSIVNNFRSVTNIGIPYATAQHGQVAEFEEDKCEPLPTEFIYTFKNKTYNLQEWLQSQWVTGLVVLKIESPTKARLLHESYYLGNDAKTKTISWSINKSVVSALIGIAITEQKINSIDDDVVVYAPELTNSGYAGTTIKDVLQMSSGVCFDEDYDKIFSDINKLGYWLALGFDIDSFICKLHSNKKPGIVHNYISSDTQVLGMVLKGATGQSLTSYLEEKLWKRCGFESDCDWLLDNEKNAMELAFGTLNTSTRDYARFGWLYLNEGLSPLDGTKIIHEQWIRDSIKCEKSYLKPCYPDRFGYGYQWWLPANNGNRIEIQGDYLAIGVYGQFIYVDPSNQIIIAMNSADPNYNKKTDIDGSNIGEIEAVEAYRAIAQHYGQIK